MNRSSDPNLQESVVFEVLNSAVGPTEAKASRILWRMLALAISIEKVGK